MPDKITIGVKFCGGCNPRFDRGVAFTEIRNQLAHCCHLQTLDPATHYKAVLVIRGCERCAFSFEGQQAEKQFILSSINEMPSLIEELKAFANA